MAERHKIELFPLGMVLLPSVPLPLHIFEERYKRLINRCIDSDESFGVVYFTGSAMKHVGCTARVTRVVKRYPDGKIDIWVQGIRRFFIHTISEESEVISAEVEWIDDEDTADAHVQKLAAEAKEFLLGLASSVGKDFNNSLLKEVDPARLSFLLAGSDGFSAPEKQRFLEMTSTTERLETGLKTLREILERIRISERIRKLIGSNGHLPAHFSS